MTDKIDVKSYADIVEDIHNRMYAGAKPVEIANLLHKAGEAFEREHATGSTRDIFSPRYILAEAGPTTKFLAEVLSEYEKTAKS